MKKYIIGGIFLLICLGGSLYFLKEDGVNSSLSVINQIKPSRVNQKDQVLNQEVAFDWLDSMPKEILPLRKGKIDRFENHVNEPTVQYQPEKLLYVFEMSEITLNDIKNYFDELKKESWKIEPVSTLMDGNHSYRASTEKYIITVEQNPKGPNTAYYYVYFGEEITSARTTLINFFDLLSSKKYDSAIDLFSPPDWQVLKVYSPFDQITSKGEDLKNYCLATQTCLQIEVLDATVKSEGDYVFNVQFREKNGDIMKYGPFGGLTEKESPPQRYFEFEVKKINGKYKVVTPPLYRP